VQQTEGKAQLEEAAAYSHVLDWELAAPSAPVTTPSWRELANPKRMPSVSWVGHDVGRDQK